ncbi:anti-sigma factor domain-containing protein [Terribacillus saccharophilus]|uniref:anti-sigma factor domain-containing protein n=1 Tax=Terribacillus saccharophilus TaxID=361277 RepID=UPI000C9B632C|nr:anti-sigma factor domain-containing protein [Terribacillus goriensis]
MKRGVVVKQSRRSTIVLTSEGTFLEISAQGQAEIGQEIEFSAQELVRRTRINHWTPSMKNFMRVAVLVLVFVLALFPVYSWFNGNKAYAYVSLDFNPSIELKVNNRMDVVSVAALNEDAKTVLANLDDWQDQDVETVAASILRISSDLGLLADSESIIIGVNYIEAKQEDKQLTSILEGSINGFNDTLHIASYQVPDKVRETAQDEQKSMNEIMAESILEGDSSKSVPALTQSDSAIIKDFYKDDVEEGAEAEETSLQTNEDPDPEPVYAVTNSAEKREKADQQADIVKKEAEQTEAKPLKAPAEEKKNEEAVRSRETIEDKEKAKEAKKQNKDEKKRAKEAEKQLREAQKESRAKEKQLEKEESKKQKENQSNDHGNKSREHEENKHSSARDQENGNNNDMDDERRGENDDY